MEINVKNVVVRLVLMNLLILDVPKHWYLPLVRSDSFLQKFIQIGNLIYMDKINEGLKSRAITRV